MSAEISNNTAASSTPRAWQVQLLVPVFNEAKNVEILYANLLSEGIDFDSLTFVYDFPEDETLPVIEDIKEKDERVVAEQNQFGRGVLKALHWGFMRSVDGPVIVLMADNSDKLSIIPEMVSRWKNGAAVVSPSRYVKGGKRHGDTKFKGFLSQVAGQSLGLLGFPTSDPTNNFKLYDGAWLREQTIESKGGFEVALELTYKAFSDGKKIEEMPTEWWDRMFGESQFKLLAWLPNYLSWYLRTVGTLLVKKLKF